ncbi:30S ribosomal protein S13 [candidate division CPR3 bacterium GWF2_35_18]|uniref:Small ribosomal subunit protein uS13 n=1 Tax=candidate division CPR3 bacterium GW2011_GWF2_35_18 TaxID=1618350 RepID=A0A0G0E349_UNCC3|nr:MAG: 30S ribosomal protein S13 [candidate division CPR3 bacterium GW2011_GWF2_35_18]OGB63150.1 MAG: 30S ribosomal protein S13 [candidate division CPR3 bacterium GWF2_35_18]OGB64036.1 MAG: 30S ribosomal protein S13 [candidate division CPR3 bacterium RIFOXYA2_FULL_35_13]OGB75694.1 MAG: 30S ribosomal protein S13 [candidate division CPR3 bacterium RIFOXYC2_FULL_35_7]OGB78233.1 MAG: 30S ribosomal protein S13 [candidate division CPR3 bacterium RIFOXYB2_FULL_35_8]
MARISGVDIPNNKRVEYSLTYIFGVGVTSSRKILAAAKIDIDKRAKDLNEDEVARIQKIIDKDYQIEGDLRREIRDNIRRYSEIKSYRGQRHEKKLPARGQRTRHNARTKRGRRVTVGGMKRKLEKT